MKDKNSLVKNSASLFIMHTLSTALMLILTIYMARAFGDARFGKYSFAVSFTGLFAVFLHLGLDLLLTREVARDKTKTGYYVGTIAGIRLVASIAVFLLAAAAVNALGYPLDMVELVYLFAAYTVLVGYGKLLKAVFQAYERMDYQSIVEIASRLFITLAGVYVIYTGGGLYRIAAVFIAGAALDLMLSAYIYSLKYARPQLNTDIGDWQKMVKAAYPFFLSYAFLMVSFKIDVVMLSLMHTDAVIGWYSASYKILEGLNIIPTAVVVAAFPVFARLYKNSKTELNKLYTQVTRFLLIIGLPIAVGATLLAPQIIDALYGVGYANSALPLKILVWAELFVFIRYVASNMLNATDQQKNNLRVVAAGAAANIILNLMLIPGYAEVGASYATLTTELLMLAGGVYYLIRSGYRLHMTKSVLKAGVASIAMACIIFVLKDLNVFALIAVGALTYFTVLYILRAYTVAGVRKMLAKINQTA